MKTRDAEKPYEPPPAAKDGNEPARPAKAVIVVEELKPGGTRQAIRARPLRRWAGSRRRTSWKA